MVEGGALEEARDLAQVALELSADGRLRSRLEELLAGIEERLDLEAEADGPELSYEQPDDAGDGSPDGTGEAPESDEAYFMALCAALPEEVQRAYFSYGEDFAAGYLALNEGDFETAVDFLSRAMEQNPSPGSYIPLELATAFLNLGNRRQAHALLLSTVTHHPAALPAYQMLCEIYWEDGAFEQAEALLAGLPPALAESVGCLLLRGETRLQAGDPAAAKGLYQQFLNAHGWNEGIARSLARAHEALGESGDAIRLYGEIMKRCSGCGSRVDAEIRQRYADLSLAAGDHGTRLLELYLSLAQEDPRRAADCYRKVSRIYAARGDSALERRFRGIAARSGKGGPPAPGGAPPGRH